MGFYLPYQSSGRGTIEDLQEKESVLAFIYLLKKRGFPEDKIKQNESGVTIETDNSVLHVDEITDGLTKQSTMLCYGHLDLVKKLEQFYVSGMRTSINLNQDNFKHLPAKLTLDPEQIQDEKNLAETIVTEILPKYHDITEYNYSKKQVRYYLAEALENKLIAKGLQKDSAEFKVLSARIVTNAYPIFTKSHHEHRQKQLELQDRAEQQALAEYQKKRIIFNQKMNLKNLCSAVLKLSGHTKQDGLKYKLLWNLKEAIDLNDYKDSQSIKVAAKNFIMLALQRNMFGISNTTKSGNKIKELLNKDEYKELRGLLFTSDKLIRYRDLRSLVCALSDKENTKFFSSSNKERIYKFFSNNENNIHSDDEVSSFVNTHKK